MIFTTFFLYYSIHLYSHKITKKAAALCRKALLKGKSNFLAIRNKYKEKSVFENKTNVRIIFHIKNIKI